MTDSSQRDSRRVFVDALNVAYWCGNPPSLRLPLALLHGLLAAGHPALLYFDASARHLLEDEVVVYGLLLQFPQHFVEVPSGRTADGVMLRHATSSGACIVSKDRYRDYRSRYRKLIDDPTRLLAGAVEDGRLLVPSLALDIPLLPSIDEAWERLKAMLD